MITSFVNGLDVALLARFFPFSVVVLAIVFLMVAKILRFGLTIAFSITMLFLITAWIFGFGDVANFDGERFLGFSVDTLGHLGLKILLPAIMVVSLMILRKVAEPSKKIEALLLVLISCLGAMVTLVSYNWMLFFIGLQCLSLPLYGLISFDPDDRWSLSSSTRYLLLSFVAMAIMLFGILLLYAATGTMELHAQGEKIRELMATDDGGVVSMGLILVFIGMAFKVSLFPFHAWAPEVYRGARLFVISYLIVIVKSAVVIFLMRSTFLLVDADTATLNAIITFMAILSMWVGNGMMLRENNFIRVLAFLSIGHLGALMIPILAHSNLAMEAVFLDIIAFGLSMMLIFSALKGLNKDRIRGIKLDDLKGLYRQQPWASVALGIAMISLAGFPLTAGFVGKFAIFQAGVDAGLWQVVGHFVVTSVIGLAVIAKIVASIWQRPAEMPTSSGPVHAPLLPELLFCVAMAIVVMGLFPEPWIAWIKGYTVGTLPL